MLCLKGGRNQKKWFSVSLQSTVLSLSPPDAYTSSLMVSDTDDSEEEISVFDNHSSSSPISGTPNGGLKARATLAGKKKRVYEGGGGGGVGGGGGKRQTPQNA